MVESGDGERGWRWNWWRRVIGGGDVGGEVSGDEVEMVVLE